MRVRGPKSRSKTEPKAQISKIAASGGGSTSNAIAKKDTTVCGGEISCVPKVTDKSEVLTVSTFVVLTRTFGHTRIRVLESTTGSRLWLLITFEVTSKATT